MKRQKKGTTDVDTTDTAGAIDTTDVTDTADTTEADRMRMKMPIQERYPLTPLDLNRSNHTMRLKTRHNASIPFFQLPQEIRNNIYGHVFDHGEIQLIDIPRIHHDDDKHSPFDLSFVATCLQAYHETSLRIFENNTFVGYEMELGQLEWLLYPAQQKAIKSIELGATSTQFFEELVAAAAVSGFTGHGRLPRYFDASIKHLRRCGYENVEVEVGPHWKYKSVNADPWDFTVEEGIQLSEWIKLEILKPWNEIEYRSKKAEAKQAEVEALLEELVDLKAVIPTSSEGLQQHEQQVKRMG
ncbi:hypothetical protein EJ08DRAFT_702613 [Tothia fuscella]|uniref:Uncharacterized protein n=1 Tax=Tothia fuscella TaxID=1048955 RepID=A0A9P4NG17_9PEZI|nr:hypothetical protein EJ08DRAFT_702613 [Tothia fuscella]